MNRVREPSGVVSATSAGCKPFAFSSESVIMRRRVRETLLSTSSVTSSQTGAQTCMLALVRRALSSAGIDGSGAVPSTSSYL